MGLRGVLTNPDAQATSQVSYIRTWGERAEISVYKTNNPPPEGSQCIAESEDLRHSAVPAPNGPHSTGAKNYPFFPKTQRKGESPDPLRNLWHIKEANQPGRGQVASQGSPLAGHLGFLRARVVWRPGLIFSEVSGK